MTPTVATHSATGFGASCNTCGSDDQDDYYNYTTVHDYDDDDSCSGCNIMSGFSGTWGIGVGMSLPVVRFAVMLMRERVNKAKHVMIAQGLRLVGKCIGLLTHLPNDCRLLDMSPVSCLNATNARCFPPPHVFYKPCNFIPQPPSSAPRATWCVRAGSKRTLLPTASYFFYKPCDFTLQLPSCMTVNAPNARCLPSPPVYSKACNFTPQPPSSGWLTAVHCHAGDWVPAHLYPSSLNLYLVTYYYFFVTWEFVIASNDLKFHK